MPFSRLFSAAFLGLDALPIEIQVDLSHQKTSSVRIVGLPDAAVKESKDRVLHAIKNSGFPIETLVCMIHLAPAEIKKAGAFYDLPIALGILQGLGAFRSNEIENYLIGGELGLAGEIRPIFGALSLSLLAKKLKKKGVIVPKENTHEAALVSGLEVIAVQSLKEAIEFFKTGISPTLSLSPVVFKPKPGSFDMRDIKGQKHAKRALEIAAAGSHNVLMSGPPGTGKTMLAKAFIGILPPLTFEEALEVTNIYSLAGYTKEVMETRPFRSPHHTISYAGMVGGGSHPKPGEISLAHRGVLFLDELPEFSRTTLEVLRQPLEDKTITISRAGGKVNFPTDIILIAAMNPCPCGYLGHPEKPCRDSQLRIDHYRQKISGPLLDRMDIHLEIPPIPYHELYHVDPEEPSDAIRQRVEAARVILNNTSLSGVDSIGPSCRSLLKEAVDAFSISARGQHRLLKVARTIAALCQKGSIEEKHLAEALCYNSKN